MKNYGNYLKLILSFLLITIILNHYLIAKGQFIQYKNLNLNIHSGRGFWFDMSIYPGSSTNLAGESIMTGSNRSATIKYASVPSMTGLIHIPPAGLLYNPIHHNDTFKIINKSNKPITFTTYVNAVSQPSVLGINHVVFIIPNSRYVSPSARSYSYTFTLSPGEVEEMHTIIITGDILSGLIFNSFPIGKYTGNLVITFLYDNQMQYIYIPISFIITN